jgi:hypothetical protein
MKWNGQNETLLDIAAFVCFYSNRLTKPTPNILILKWENLSGIRPSSQESLGVWSINPDNSSAQKL